MAVNSKLIQVRYGAEADYDESKMTTGEPAVTTDTERVFFGTGPGKAVELARKKDLEKIGTEADSELNEKSTNPIQNQAVAKAVSQLSEHIDEFGFEADINLFNPSKVVNGYITSNGQEFSTGTNKYSTEFIPVVGGEMYSWTGESNLGICTYTKDKIFIERILTYTPLSYTSMEFSNDVAFVRLIALTDGIGFGDEFMFVKGTLPSEYIPYEKKLPFERVKGFYLSDGEVNEIADRAVEIAGITEKSINLFNYADLVDGYYKGDGVGYYEDGISKRTNNFISVDGGSTYIWSKGNLATIGVYQIMINTYTVDKTPIERFLTYANGNRYNSITFNENVAFVKLSDYGEEFASDFMFVKGDTLPEVFVPYGEYIKENLFRPYNGLVGGMNILWFGDSISMLRLLPHRVGQNLSSDVSDCSIAGSPFVASTNADYQTLGVKSMIEAKISGDMTAQYTAINNLATANGWTDNDKAIRLAQVQTLENANMNDIDCAVILAGTNDHNTNVTLEVFKSGIKNAIEEFVTAYPHIELYLISPTWRGDMTTNGISLTLEQYVNAEKEIAEAYQIPFYDLYHSCGINTQNQGYFLNTDKLHPSEKGDMMLAKKCARWLASN